MRRSKSNPAKYARNYRKISQRHMTTGGADGRPGGEKTLDDEQRRLEAILEESEATWRRGLAEGGRGGKNGGDDDDAPSTINGDAGPGQGEDGMLALLSPELRAQFSGMDNSSLLILPGKKDKKSKRRAPPPLTPAEIKAAKALYKNTLRKLAQLEQRRRRKEVRAGLYKELEAHALVPHPSAGGDDGKKGGDHGEDAAVVGAVGAVTAAEAHSLLLKSSELGKKVTKRERLKQLKRKEALGMALTEEELGVLYVTKEAPGLEEFEASVPDVKPPGDRDAATAEKAPDLEEGADAGSGAKRKKRKKKKRPMGDGGEDNGNVGAAVGKEGEGEVGGSEQAAKKARLEPSASAQESEDQPASAPAKMDATDAVESTEKSSPEMTNAEDTNSANADADTKPAPSYSQMMFAGLSSLKTKTDTRNVQLAEEKARKQREEEERAAQLEEEERKKRKVYVPSETVRVSTMHRLDVEASEGANDATGTLGASAAAGPKGGKRHTVVRHIDRPAAIEESRYDLPVSAMEYEIVDAVRNNDCTILCGETGSGKSTQVPQFLYEAGFSAGSYVAGGDTTRGDVEAGHLLIGITQPRRVAAVSTAKRVGYEMGCGNGQSIASDNLVAYQTRYETAGLGPSTHVKFMTDGILLQEVQSDLLLRKYGAVVIDEAHERNLNTDVLLGLLSVALPLRRKAAEEGSLPPLKLVVMSATLRVEDFTQNERLFPQEGRKPALVTVPGRTHPVSIHHSKVTEMDDYEKVAMEKVCKIHRKLPAGGILVFLTGKQEIVRCVNRLRRRLEPREPKSNDRWAFEEGDVDQATGADAALDGGFRDMDDEEVDGDLFQKGDFEEGEDDYDNVDNLDDEDLGAANGDDKQPKKVRILPLYSMLSADEQAKVFAPVPEDTRLIVVATNIAETSITIPGISYVVDSGRQKCRNYHAGTGVASYDIMWISKAAADQRAGRAGRTGPGHCYRLYSSSVYSRYLDEFALPEVLTRPLEDVVLAMKAMKVSNVTSFPFPTPPEQGQINAAVRLLANLGCVDVSRMEELGGDGTITPLGAAVAKLPLGVRYGKMLLVAAQANVLDYAIALVAVLSESTPFAYHTEEVEKSGDDTSGKLKGLDDVDRNQALHKEKERKREMKSRWTHDGGDVLAALKAVGAYAYAGRGAGGNSEKLACRKFCEENGLHLVVMQRIAKMRLHLCKLAKARLPHAGGIAAETGQFLPTMPPPKRIQESLLRQAIAAGLLDNIARRAPPGVLPSEFARIPRSAYICGNSRLKQPLFIDSNSTVHSARPEWVCFDSIVRKTKKDGSTVATMQKVTPIDPEWLATLCHGSNLLTLGSPLATPLPRYVKEKDSIQCAVDTKFGGHGWGVPPAYLDMYETVQNESKKDKKKQSSAVMEDDSFRWFARYLLEGKVLSELDGLLRMLNDEPAIITRRKPAKKVLVLVSALSNAGVDSAAALTKHWREKDDKFLFKALKPWVKQECAEDAKQMWIATVRSSLGQN